MTNKLSHLAALRANSKRFSILVAAVAVNLCLAYQAHALCHPGTTQQCRIQTAHQPGWLKTAYTIVSVDYVPPGTGSYVEYGVGGQVGTTVSTTDSWQSSLEVERGADVSFQGVSLLSETVNFGNAWGGTTTTSIDQQASYAATTRINGPAYPYETVSDTFIYRTNNNYSSSSTAGSSTSHTVKVTASGGASLLRLRVSAALRGNTTLNKGSARAPDAETFFLTMPSLDYSGTTVMYLYIDKIYKTFMVSPIGPS